MRQYEIRWASLPAPIGRRPVLLLTRSSAYAYLNKVIVAEVTTTIRDIAQEVVLDAAEGLASKSVANLDNIHVIPTSIVGDRLGSLAPQREREVKRALGHALGWRELQGV
ncbi:MAG: type II toxin-antitoxin system PemK/MazF family toxin [Candidatus Binatia bacterium]